MKRGKRVYRHLIIVSLVIVVMLLGAIFYSSGTLNKVGAVIKSKVKPPTAIKKDLITKLKPQFQLRQSKMADLIEKDPAAFLRIVYSKNFRDKLDPKLKSYVEEEVTKEGTLSVEHSDDFEQGISRFYYYLNTAAGQRFRLHFAEEGPALLSGSVVRVQGVKIGKDIALRSSGGEDLQIIKVKLPSSAITNKPSPVTGSIVHWPDLQEQLDLQEEIVSSTKQQLQELFIVKKVAVIMLNFQNDPRQPLTEEFLRERIFTAEDSVNAYYQEVSYGKLYLTGKNNPDGDIYGWFTVPYDTPDCEGSLNEFESEWILAANAAASTAGADLSVYDNIIYIVPSCSYAQGQVGGRYSLHSVVETEPTTEFSRAAVHELGHNFGFNHANGLYCFDQIEQVQVAIGTICESKEYFDLFDVMGSRMRHFNSYHKQELGLLTAAQMATIIEPGEFELELTPQEQPGLSDLKLVRIERGNYFPPKANNFYLEYRQPFGFDNFESEDPVVNGVSIRLGGAPGNIALVSHLIDTNLAPTTALDENVDKKDMILRYFENSALAVGQTFVDELSGISITTESVSPASAMIRVIKTQPTACYQDIPTIIITNAAGSGGETLTYPIEIQNNANLVCTPQSFLISLDSETLPAGWSISPFSTQMVLGPGQETTVNFALTSAPTALPGVYVVNLLVALTGSNLYSPSVKLEYWVYDCNGGVCISPCGNGVVNPGEDCTTCPLDRDDCSK